MGKQNEKKEMDKIIQQNRLGKSDLYVNSIGLGANTVGGHNLYLDLNEEVGKGLVHTALNQVINFLDTAYQNVQKSSSVKC